MPRPQPHVPGVEHRFVELATGIRMHVADAGPADGPPVLLLHGWPQHWWCWRGVIPPLADAGLRVLAADLRGFGWSDTPAGGYDKEQLASDVLALLDALAIERVTLVGHDWGGWTAQLLALRAPERVEQLVLCNIAPVWPGSRTAALKDAWRFLYQPLVAAPRLGVALQHSRLMTRGMPGVPVPAREEFAAALREPGHAEAGSLIYRTFLVEELGPVAAGRYDGRRLAMRTLVLHGTADPAIRPAMVEPFTEHGDDVRIEWLHGAGHFVADERPEVLAAHVLAFLAEAPRAG